MNLRKDLYLHFAISFVIMLFLSLFCSILLSIVLTLAIGLSKEFFDMVKKYLVCLMRFFFGRKKEFYDMVKENPTGFSWQDIGADALGILAANLFLLL